MDIVTARPAPQTAPTPPSSSPTFRFRSAAPVWQLALVGLALFGWALLPRLIGLEQNLTADDQDWIRRVAYFSQAIQRGNLRETYQSAHPGLPLFWLAVAAIGPRQSAELALRAGDLTQLEKSPSYLGAVFAARRALALAAAALIVLLTFLAWRLFGPGPALLSGLLLANEPFLVAHGRLLHTDLLLAELMAASVLAALLFFGGRGGWPYLVGSGLAAGLALSTKVPGVLLFGFVPLLGLNWTWQGGGLGLAGQRRLIGQLAIWGLAAGLIYVLLWPALWVDPVGTLARMLQAVRGVGESPRRWGNFFLGRAIRDDVGPLFYPVVTLLRLSPITLVGLLLLTWFGQDRSRPSWRPLATALLAYCGLFTLMMTLSPKKLDRYLLPVFPIVVILAALGFWTVLRFAFGQEPRRRWSALLALGLSQAALVTAVQPYPLSFYDPALGGIGLARQLVIVGWGEGTDQVATYLDGLPNSSDVVVTSLYNDLIQAQFQGSGVPLWQWQRADYLADYVNMDQRGLVPGPLQTLVQTQAPVFSARINGLEYARLYRIPPDLKSEGGSSSGPRGANVPHP